MLAMAQSTALCIVVFFTTRTTTKINGGGVFAIDVDKKEDEEGHFKNARLLLSVP